MRNENDYSLGYYLKKRRKTLGKTQREIADLLNITTNYYGEIERGKKDPSLELYKSICNKLSLPNNLSASNNELDVAFSILSAHCPEEKKGDLTSLIKALDNLIG